MANAAPHYSSYAPSSPGDGIERQLLAALPFVGRRQAEYCLDASNAIERVRSELHRVYPSKMAELDANIRAEAERRMAAEIVEERRLQQRAEAIAARIVDTEARSRSEQKDRLSRIFQTGAYAADAARSTTYDAKTGIQRFGVGVAK